MIHESVRKALSYYHLNASGSFRPTAWIQKGSAGFPNPCAAWHFADSLDQDQTAQYVHSDLESKLSDKMIFCFE